MEKDLYLQVCQKYAVHPVKFYKEIWEERFVGLFSHAFLLYLSKIGGGRGYAG